MEDKNSFIGKVDRKKLNKPFPITGICRADLESEGFDTSQVDDDDMKNLATEMADAYCNFGYWIDLNILADQMGIKKR